MYRREASHGMVSGTIQRVNDKYNYMYITYTITMVFILRSTHICSNKYRRKVKVWFIMLQIHYWVFVHTFCDIHTNLNLNCHPTITPLHLLFKLELINGDYNQYTNR